MSTVSERKNIQVKYRKIHLKDLKFVEGDNVSYHWVPLVQLKVGCFVDVRYHYCSIAASYRGDGGRV